MKRNLSRGSLRNSSSSISSSPTDQIIEDESERQRLFPGRIIDLNGDDLHSVETNSFRVKNDTETKKLLTPKTEPKKVQKYEEISSLIRDEEEIKDEHTFTANSKTEQIPFSDIEDQNCTKPSIGTVVRIVLLVLLLTGISVFLGFLIGSTTLQAHLIEALEWLSHLPKWASALLVMGMYAFSLLLFCPGTPFNLAAGFLFGVWIGSGVAMGGCVLGASFSFLLGRTIAREWVKEKMESRPSFKAVDWAIEKNGVKIVFLTRLSPLFPFPLLNYAFGITKVATWQYLLGTTAGVLPATIGYTYLGTLMRSLTDIWTAGSDNNSPNLVWLVVGSALTVLSIIVISWITKRAMDKATKDYELLQNDPPLQPSLVDLEGGSLILSLSTSKDN